jgi:uncharacterized membrane protein YeaQ/YmgE (transglycosylase-associated protein family)
MVLRALIWIVSGVIAGWLTGLVVKGRGFGFFGDLLIGFLGGLLGGWLFRFIGVSANSWLGEIIVAVIGGVLLVAIVRLIRRV